MKNLKRILSLALAGTMLVGMMVVGASAADFTDADKIEHTGAVETLAALGIVTGNPQTDGTLEFNPQGDLRRVELAVMLAKIANKGTVPTWAVKENPSFTDVKKGYWGEAVIEYCASLGIVNGYDQADGTRTFAPEAPVTATEAARMILNFMGYKIAGGRDWALETEIQARDENLNLYKGLDEVVTNKAISRDNVAQMLYTALNAPMAGGNTYTSTSTEEQETGKYNIVPVAGDGNDELTALGAHPYGSFLEAYLVATAVEITPAEESTAAVMAKLGTHFNLEPVMTDVTVTSTKAESLGHKYMAMDEVSIVVKNITVANGKYKVNGAYIVDTDPSALMGLSATAVVKKNADGTVAMTYGINATGKILYTGLVKDITKTDAEKETMTIAGKDYGFTATTKYTWNDIDTSVSGNGWDELTVIDNNGDGKIDMMVVKPVTVTDIDTVASNGKLTITGVNLDSENTEQPIDPAKNTVDEGLEEGDWVIVTTDVAGKYTVTKAPIVENVRYTKKNANGSLVIGGVTYVDATAETDEGADDSNLGSNFDPVAYQGYVFAMIPHTGAPAAKANISDVVYVLKVDTGVKSDASSEFAAAVEASKYWLNVQIQKQDNTKAVIEVGSVNGTALTKTSTNSVVTADALYIMTTNDKGVVNLTAVAADKFNDLADGTVANTIANGELGDTRIAEDAVVFVKLGTGDDAKVECMTGKALGEKKVEAPETGDNFDTTNSKILTKEGSDKFTYVALGILIGDTLTQWPDAMSDDLYGYITAGATKEYLLKGEKGAAADGVYYSLKLWDGENEADYLLAVPDEGDDTYATTYKAGKLIAYQVVGETNLLDPENITSLTVTAGEVKAYDGKMVKIDSTVYDTSAKTTIVIFVDSAKTAKAEAGTIKFAKSGTANVATATNDTTTIILVDANNKMVVVEDEDEEPGDEDQGSGDQQTPGDTPTGTD